MSTYPGNRFVAHFDMLGMKSLTTRNPDLAWKKLSALNSACRTEFSLKFERLDTTEVVENRVKWFMFSDTVIAFTRGESDSDAMAIVILSTELFTLSLDYGIPVRGAIAHGRFDFDAGLGLFSGPALVDAHLLGESSQWLGIVVDETTADRFTNLPSGRSPRGRDMIIPWDVPCKNSIVRPQKVLCWPESHYKSYRGPHPLTVAFFYSLFAELFGPFETLAPSAAVKYENTVDFFNKQYMP